MEPVSRYSVGDAPRRVEPDGLYVPTIKRHSLSKIHLHNRYARIMATAMRTKWNRRAYVGLYSGAGHAQIYGTSEIYETSALAVFRQPDPFTDYLFVDRNPTCASALGTRIARVAPAANYSVIAGDVNGSIDEVLAKLPMHSQTQKVLTFCFADPFDLKLHFETVRRLAERRVDFLILLALGFDARRNIVRYYRDLDDRTIGDLIADPQWRDEYRASGEKRIVHFMLRKFDEGMRSLGYLTAAGDEHSIKKGGVLLYHLVFYSRSELAKKFWRHTCLGITKQPSLFD
jgi:three-Cys-motif partner protein